MAGSGGSAVAREPEFRQTSVNRCVRCALDSREPVNRGAYTYGRYGVHSIASLISVLLSAFLGSGGLWSWLQYKNARQANALNAAKVIADVQRTSLTSSSG
jgi:hypothetical protein